jgi:antitoxin YefM
LSGNGRFYFQLRADAFGRMLPFPEYVTGLTATLPLISCLASGSWLYVRYYVPSCPVVKGNKMHTLTASKARANLYRIIDETAESHEPIIISGKRTSAVLLSAEDWSAIQETLYLLAVPGMRESIKAGMAEPLTKSGKALKW